MMTDEFVKRLIDFSALDVFNPWHYPAHRHEEAIAANLRLYNLRRHHEVAARFVLVGEAPGYQGCRVCGVPFGSERLIRNGKMPRLSWGGKAMDKDSGRLGWTEPSATIVWGILHELGIAETTVCWNAFPWHPHRPGDLLSNRKPTPDEVQEGRWFLQELIEDQCYKGGATLVAVGNTAADALVDLGYEEFPRVRHPANGGATKFREQMRSLVARS